VVEDILPDGMSPDDVEAELEDGEVG